MLFTLIFLYCIVIMIRKFIDKPHHGFYGNINAWHACWVEISADDILK